MLIGCCGNCKYTDLLQDILDTCPRCGARMVSLGIESFDWNDLDPEGRQKIIDATFPPDSPEGAEPPIPDTFWELYPKREPKPKPEIEAEAEYKPEAEDTAEYESEAEPETETVNADFEQITGIVIPIGPEPEAEPEPVPDMTMEVEAESEPVPDPIIEPGPEPDLIFEKEPEKESETEPAKEPETEPAKEPDKELADLAEHTGNSGNVYVCYRCNSIAGVEGICPECGSDMINTGYTARQWAFLSKEEKRQAAEDAKIRHMVSAIQEATFEDPDDVSTQSIINVVKQAE